MEELASAPSGFLPEQKKRVVTGMPADLGEKLFISTNSCTPAPLLSLAIQVMSSEGALVLQATSAVFCMREWELTIQLEESEH